MDASGECEWMRSDLKYFHALVIIFIQVGICWTNNYQQQIYSITNIMYCGVDDAWICVSPSVVNMFMSRNALEGTERQTYMNDLQFVYCIFLYVT